MWMVVHRNNLIISRVHWEPLGLFDDFAKAYTFLQKEIERKIFLQRSSLGPGAFTIKEEGNKDSGLAVWIGRPGWSDMHYYEIGHVRIYN